MDTHKGEIKKHLTTILSYEPEDNILEYLLGMETEADFEEFTHNIMDIQSTAHQRAYDAIRDILFRNKNPKTKMRYKGNSNNNGTSDMKRSHVQDNNVSEQSFNAKSKNASKGKKKFQDIKQFKEKEKIKKGHTECTCQGQIHGFMNNCLNCGRIHCLEEGPGPCLYCGIYLNEYSRDDKAPDCAPKKNVIYDDDNDYFKINRDNDKKKRSMVVSIDLATRRVIESTEEDERLRKKMLEDCKKHLKNVEQLFKNLQISSEFKPVANLHEEMVNLLLRMRHVKPKGVEPDLEKEDALMPDVTFKTKIFSEGFDQGLCLSMHQPYVSLLIAGVKKHEGRNWPTNHRGVLWIAAAAHKPEPEDIEYVEKFYRKYYDDPSLKFPTTYPTSCLLGCVEVEDCLSQEMYRKQYPNGESESPFVLICENPIILPIFYPIIGQHKIYPLDKDLHKCAKMCLRFANLMDG